jgi:glycosyltransferase involved in cell wall biosynthesis
VNGSKKIYQVNMQRHFGGGEVYTHFFSKALQKLGWHIVLFVDARAKFWNALDMSGIDIIPVGRADRICEFLPERGGLVITHGPFSGRLLDRMKAHVYCSFAHMPLYQRRAEPFVPCRTVFGVSQYVLDTLAEKGLTNYYPIPLYGVADLKRNRTDMPGEIWTRPSFDWDEQKGRDLALSYLHPIYWILRPKHRFHRQEGLTLGIISRITTIKQFPWLFRILSPIIRRYESVKIEIFGSGGYASMRDLKKSLKPIRSQVRFWGHQDSVENIYPMMDFVLTGLPEKEALGLNVIEAQACNTPVLAVQAAPFTETVLEGKTGFFYTDPRQDGGQDFERLLKRIFALDRFPRPLDETEHLKKYSFDAFTERVEKAVEFALSGHGSQKRKTDLKR